MQDSKKIIENCKVLLEAFKSGKLGQTRMPEDSNPRFKDDEMELRFAYFSLPMALNYQRNSYTLWESALKTYQDEETKNVFDVAKVSQMNFDKLQSYLLKYKLALQPNKHTTTWQTIAKTINNNFGSFVNLIDKADTDYLKLKVITQKEAETLSKDAISNRWREVLKDSGIAPIEMHPPLWFWSRNGFIFKI